jgi:hypothetical protein
VVILADASARPPPRADRAGSTGVVVVPPGTGIRTGAI